MAAAISVLISSVAAKLLHSNVISIHTRVREHRLEIPDHLAAVRRCSRLGRHCGPAGTPLPSDVDLSSTVNQASFPFPGTMGFLQLRHGRNQFIVRVLLFEGLQFFEEWRIFRPAIRVEKEDPMR